MIALLLIVVIVLIIIFRPKYKNPEVIRGALTDEECEYIKKRAEPLLEKSTLSDNNFINT